MLVIPEKPNYMQTITVVIADDHEIYRDGLKMMLETETWIKVIGEASNGNQLIQMAKQLKPDVIITDVSMPQVDGIAALKEIVNIAPDTCAIALSTYDEESTILGMLEAGALGYLLKNADKDEILKAIKAVYKSQPYYCKTTTSNLANLISKTKLGSFKTNPLQQFSEREIELVRLVCEEKTNKEISQELFLSSRTIEGYRTRIMQKMGTKSTVGFVVYAIKTGIFKVLR